MTDPTISGRVGSRGFQISRVESGHNPRDTGHVTGRAALTRVVFSSDPRIGPAELTREFNTLKTYYFLQEDLFGAETSS